ncbi:aminoglycoside adenylyltransferase domain-containing protein [Enterococcus sp. AZ196]|uniref:aminoglycoside adenylyltransferase domain-containing protein n=1 Tax=Enterococcus sp. AZ196 TaxID=2774659 RepID=UPI003D2D3D0D
MNHSISTDKQIESILQLLSQELSEGILGIYLCGSAVLGGLKQNSDIDILVVVSEKLSKETKKSLIKKIKPLSRKIGENNALRYVEIIIIVAKQIATWEYPPYQDFIYGEWLQEDYEKGYVPSNEQNADLTIILYQSRKHYKRLLGSFELEKIIPEIPIEDVKKAIMDSVSDLLTHYDGDETNVLLTLCRMILTLKENRVYPKDLAGAIQARTSPFNHRQLILLAVSDYKGEKLVKWENYSINETINYLYQQLKKET